MDNSIQKFDFAQYQPASAIEQEIIRLEFEVARAQAEDEAASDRDVAVLRRRLADARQRKESSAADDVDKDLRRWIVEDDIHFELENAKFRRRDRSEEWQLISGPAILATRPACVAAGEEALNRLRKNPR